MISILLLKHNLGKKFHKTVFLTLPLLMNFMIELQYQQVSSPLLWWSVNRLVSTVAAYSLTILSAISVYGYHVRISLHWPGSIKILFKHLFEQYFYIVKWTHYCQTVLINVKWRLSRGVIPFCVISEIATAHFLQVFMLSHMPDKTSLVYMRQANCIFHVTIVFVWYTLILKSLSPFVCFCVELVSS